MNERNNNIQDELKEIAPLLSSFNKQQKSAPVFYFENMQQRVLNEINIAQHESTLFDKWLNILLQIFHPKYALPFATITLLFVVATVLHLPENNIAPTSNEVALNKQSISNFLAEEDISIDIISINLSNAELEKITLLFASNSIQKNSINDYILDDIDEAFPAEMTL